MKHGGNCLNSILIKKIANSLETHFYVTFITPFIKDVKEKSTTR